jgi:DNA-binding winged helix-turn-helix (wHTH) protein/tetratricopeptide (TPR) repeat protein
VPTIANDKRIDFDRFSLDLVNECLWQGAEAIKVRPKAFALLSYLLGRPGQLVTKDELLSAVWPETFVSDAVLKVTIRQLREALGDDPKTPRFIETAHRRGYRFIAQLAPNASSPAPATPVFSIEQTTVVGRDTALARLHNALQKMLRGERQIVFITGEAGIGKTSLVDAFIESIQPRGSIRIGRGQCLEQYGTGEAYLPLLEAIGRLCRDEELLVQLLRDHAPLWLLQMPALLTPAEREVLLREVSGASRERMLREIGEALVALTTESPLVLVLEDLHWSDYSTLDLISYLANQRASAHLMLIGTFRNVELIVNRHPLKAVKQELLAKHQCEELPLEYLNEESVSKYLSSRFPEHQFPERLAQLIHERTDGNPLFMVNAVNYVLETGLIVEREGLWQFVAGAENIEVGVPDNIKQMIEKQVEHLSAEHQSTLAAASVAGAEFSTFALAGALAEELDEVEARCEELARQGQYLHDRGIQELPNGDIATRYGFVHALYQNVLYQRLSSSHRIQMHRRIGERLENIYGERSREVAAELAMHFERGRDYKRAAKYLQQAADNAMRRYAYRESVALARRGIEMVEKMPESPEQVSQALCLQLTLGVPLIAIEGYASPNVGSVYLKARDLLQRVGDTPDVAEVLWGVWTFYTLRAELQTAREVAEQFFKLNERLAYPGLQMRSHLVMHVTFVHQGEFDKALVHYEKAAALFEPKRHVDDAFFYAQNPGVALSCFGAWTLWFLGKFDKSLELMLEALRVARELDEPHGLAHAHLFAAILHQWRREPRKALDYADAVLAIAKEHGLVMYQAQAMIIRSWSAAEIQSREEAISQIRQAIAAYRATGTGLLRPHFTGLLAELLGSTGKVDEGLREIEPAIELAQRSDDASYLAELYRIKGVLLLESGRDDADVEEYFKKSIAVAQQQCALSWELRATVSLANFYLKLNKKSLARESLARVYDQFTEGFETWDLREAKALLEIV